MTPVPSASIVGMIFTLLISVAVPVAAFIIAALKWKGKAGISSFFIGAASFVLFAMVLERILHTIVFRFAGTLFTNHIFLYALYGGLAAGLFEETGRFLAMKYCIRDRLNRENAILYGIGHGGAEAILIVGLTYVNNLTYSLLINSGTLPSLLSTYDEGTRQTIMTQLDALGTTAGYQFYMAGVERISAMLLHVVLSYLVYLAIRNHKMGCYVLAVFIHAAIDAGTVLLSAKVSIILMEVILIAAVVLLAAVVYLYERRKDFSGR